MFIRARAIVIALVLIVSSALLMPAALATQAPLQSGEARIVTAPGLVATFTAQDAQIGTERPARTRFNRADRTSRNAQAILTFPAERLTREDQIVFGGSMTLRTKDQQLTLRNITVDLRQRVVFVSVKEFFGLTIEAFTIANTPTQRITRKTNLNGTTSTTTIISNAQLVVSESAGQQLSSAIGDPNFGAGARLGTATLRYTTVS